MIKNFPEGHPRPYVRDGVAGISREEQSAILAAAGVPLDQLFEDKLSRPKIKRRAYGELLMLAEMLKPTTRTTPETIFVATPQALGWTIAEVARSIAAAFRRNASIVLLDRDKIIPCGDGVAAMEVLSDLEGEQKKARYIASLSKARAATQRRRNRKWQKAKLIAEPLWAMPSEEMPVHRIVARLAEAGLPYSAKTLYNRLGNREDAQR